MKGCTIISAIRPRTTRVDSPIDEALRSRQGVCQDFAHIMIALVRQLGIPCRYVSGYLYHRQEDNDRSISDAIARMGGGAAAASGMGGLRPNQRARRPATGISAPPWDATTPTFHRPRASSGTHRRASSTSPCRSRLPKSCPRSTRTCPSPRTGRCSSKRPRRRRHPRRAAAAAPAGARQQQ